MIDLLSNAVFRLGLSNESKIDFTMVKKRFIKLAKATHPDKNTRSDNSFDSIIEAYRTLEYYFNVFLAGKNCIDCFHQVLNRHNDELIKDIHDLPNFNNNASYNDNNGNPLYNEMVNISFQHPGISGTHRKSCKGQHELGKVCHLHSIESSTPRFYSNISKDECLVYGNIAGIQCRCGQFIMVSPAVLALGITTFDCDVCSCSYIITDVN